MLASRLAPSLLVVGSLAWSGLASAGAVVAVAREGGGQPSLAVGFDPAGQIRARVCRAAPCPVDGGDRVEVPEDAARRSASAKITVSPIGLDRRAVVVEIPPSGGARGWAAIVLAPLSGDHPLVPFSGYTGSAEGVDGERSGPVVLVRGGAVYVAQQREDLTLCGRPAPLSPEALDPATLTLKPAKLQRLEEAERAQAPRISAERASGESPPSPRLLRAEWATSAADGHAVPALTDGDPATTWAENRGGVGRGEFAVLRAPREVPIEGFELALGGDTLPHAVSPAGLWIATDHELFRVELPESKGATRYSLSLPAKIRTSCVALVLDDAKTTDKEARVGVSELSARASIVANVPELVRALSGGGPEAEAAGGVLRALGVEAAKVLAGQYSSLDEGGRRVALDVLDDAPCDVALPVYLEALQGSVDAHKLHARSALARCGRAAADALARSLAEAKGAARAALGEELVEYSPGAAIDGLAPWLDRGSRAERRAARELFRRAAQSDSAREAVVRALGGSDVGGEHGLAVLRALGDLAPAFGDAAARAFASVASQKKDFRTRFLLLEPAALLSKSDGSARSFLRAALSSDASPHVRAEAARVVREPALFHAELSRALDDPDVRVREAATTALGEGRLHEAAARLAYRLKEDPWPLVRTAAAHALGRLRPDPATDAVLSDAVSDEAPTVRVAALEAIGRRGVPTSLELVRDRLDDEEEIDTVRAAAALSLGALCDRSSLDRLTRHARRMVSPTAELSDYRMGQNAVLALAALGPKDLRDRLSPLLDKKAPSPVQRLARGALRLPAKCGGGAASSTPARPR